MEAFQLVAIALSFMVALTCSWAVLKPFFDDIGRLALESEGGAIDLKRTEELVLRKERLFEELEDLEVDHLSARVPEVEYEAARRELDAEAASVMSELDSLRSGRVESVAAAGPGAVSAAERAGSEGASSSRKPDPQKR